MHYTSSIVEGTNQILVSGESIIVTRIYSRALFVSTTMNFFEADRVTPIFNIVLKSASFDLTTPFLAPRGLYIVTSDFSQPTIIFHTEGGA